MNNQHLLNEKITARRVLLLGSEGEKLGEFSIQEALKQAEGNNLDLMQVGMNKDTAICKIINYESWVYHEQKKKHKQEVKNKSQELKNIQLRPVIGENDLNLKLKKVEEFLSDNHKVKIVIRLKSREGSMRSINEEFINKVTSRLADYGVVDGNVNWSFKEINFIIKPEKKVVLKVKP